MPVMSAPYDQFAGFNVFNPSVEPMLILQEMQAMMEQTTSTGASGFLAFHADTLLNRAFRRAQDRLRDAYLKTLKTLDPITSANYLQVLLNYCDIILGYTQGVNMAILDQLPALLVAGAGAIAAGTFADWVLANWPFDTGNYRYHVVNSISVKVQGDQFTVGYSTDGVLNRSGYSYVPFVEQRHQIMAKANMALMSIIQQSITAILPKMEAAL
jgi:hypothetical protein